MCFESKVDTSGQKKAAEASLQATRDSIAAAERREQREEARRASEEAERLEKEAEEQRKIQEELEEERRKREAKAAADSVTGGDAATANRSDQAQRLATLQGSGLSDFDMLTKKFQQEQLEEEDAFQTNRVTNQSDANVTLGGRRFS